MLTLGSAGVGDRRAREGRPELSTYQFQPIQTHRTARLAFDGRGLMAIYWNRLEGSRARPRRHGKSRFHYEVSVTMRSASRRGRRGRWPAIARVKAVRKSIKSVGQSEPSASHTAGRGGGRPIRRAIDSYPPAVDSGRLSNPITRRPASRFDTTERLSMSTASVAIPESRSPSPGRPSMASGRGRVERESIRFRPVDGRRLADCRQVVSQIA